MSIDVNGLVREFLLIVFLYMFDIGTQFATYSEAEKARTRYDSWMSGSRYVENGTREFEFCKNTDWNRRDYKEKVSQFADVVDLYLAFLLLAGSILVCYILVYVWFVLRSLHRAIYLEENRDRIVKVKFTFGFLLSFFLDIPGSCITVGLYSMRCGSAGLHCWDCAQDAGCTDKRELRHRVYISQVVVVVMFFGLCMVSLWKGITTFYRWSKTDRVDCWQLRGCVALFVGTYYVMIVLTPALAVFKYKFFMLPSQKENVFANFTDSLFMVGLLGWIIFSVVGCCFPLVKCLRDGTNPNTPPDAKKTYQSVLIG